MMRTLVIVTIFFVSQLSFANDLSTPEATIAGYIRCFSTASEDCVLMHYHGINTFYTGDPHEITFEVVKKIVYTGVEIKKWNDAGIVPRAKIGDVQLNLRQKTGEYENMYSYNLRRYEDVWLIYSHSAWGVD